MSKDLCYVGIALHPQARKNLEERFEITEDPLRIKEADAAIVYGVPEEWINPGVAEHLKAIGCHSCDELQRKWVDANKIQITFADSLWRTVAELTLGLAMTAARNIVPAHRDVREGKWKDHESLKVVHSGVDFQGKTFGILGMGQIGIPLADMLRGFRMQVIYYDCRRLSEEKEKELGISYVSYEELLEQSDFLSVLVPLKEDTAGMLGREAFLRMKKGCVLVNTARAGIIDEDAFLEALENGTVGAAALDVFWSEAAPQRPELTERDNVIMTPHLGGSTCECDMVLVNGVMKS